MQQYPAGTTSADIKNLDGFFVVVDERSGFKKGDILELLENDLSEAPLFRSIKTKEWYCVDWSSLAPASKGFWYGGLEVGDFITKDSFQYKIIEVSKSSFMIATGTWYTYEQAISHRWKILGAEQPKSKIELFEKHINETRYVDAIEEGVKRDIINKAKEIFGDK